MATLHVTAGNEKGKSFPVTGNELRVGRGTDQDVVLTDVSASRRHFSIVKDGNRWKIQDHGSGNGTLLNGVRVPSAHLKDGDVLEIGQTAFRFEEKAAKPVMAASQPKPLPPSAQMQPMGTPSSGAMAPVPSGGGIGTGAKVMLYSMMLLLSAGSVGIILTRTVLAKPVVIQSQADLVFKQGLHFFAAGEYESAKASFTEAQKAAPDSAAVKRYLGLCESEAANKEKYKAGEKLLNAHKYDEAKKQLENVETSSVHYDRAMILMREAKQHEGQAAPAVAAATPAPAPVEKAEKVEKAAPVKVAAKVETASKATKDDTKMKPVNVMKSNPTAPPVVVEEKGTGPVADSKAAMAMYKNRDFVGAARTYRLESNVAKDGGSAMKLIQTAKAVEGVKDLLERAGNEEKSTPDKAVKTYEEAMAADQKLSKGALQSYIKGKIGGMSLQTAKQAFTNGKYDQSFQLAMSAQKAGSPDAGALLKQLDQKAGELLAKAQSQQKTNPTEAKNLARQVQKMVPSGSQNFIKAYQIVNSSGAPRRDEDE